MDKPTLRVLQKIDEKVWKVHGWSNFYFLDFDEKILIDCGLRSDKRLFENVLSKLVPFDKIGKIIITHFHFDHIGNFDLFPNAQLFASGQEIEDFRADNFGSVLEEDTAGKFSKAKLSNVEDLDVKGLKIIPTPGHTRGSVCIWLPDKKILFTGDTLFFKGIIGRTDLPTSDEGRMQETLNKLVSYNYRILCPGHDYGLTFK